MGRWVRHWFLRGFRRRGVCTIVQARMEVVGVGRCGDVRMVSDGVRIGVVTCDDWAGGLVTRLPGRGRGLINITTEVLSTSAVTLWHGGGSRAY